MEEVEQVEEKVRKSEKKWRSRKHEQETRGKEGAGEGSAAQPRAQARWKRWRQERRPECQSAAEGDLREPIGPQKGLIAPIRPFKGACGQLYTEFAINSTIPDLSLEFLM